ncbi:LysR family transcriptional regulator [Arthrobacter sp. cf158]|uniref:LysR family transcriptional regulator n=1 Tax=Arthrobacter sp. cf158 TaxID=1761744 RepID=UPI00267713B0|nr:LysR family transcriptional regulator [Arthrobacter sp. cf158]
MAICHGVIALNWRRRRGDHTVEMRQLQALLAVADTGSVTKAAELLHIVQPAVTRQIHNLEAELGTSLFDRSRSGMRLTEIGAQVVERARRALNELDRAREEARTSGAGLHGIVTVGLLASTASLLAVPLVSAVTERHPGVRLRVVTGYGGHLSRWLEAGDVDVALTYNQPPATGLDVKPLLEEALWAVAPPAAATVRPEGVDLSELLLQSLVMPSAPHAIRSLVESAAARLNVPLDIAVETNDAGVQKQLVQSGLGWTVLPGIMVADEAAGGVLNSSPIVNPEIPRKIVLVRPSGTRAPGAGRMVADLLEDVVLTRIASGKWPSARLVV